MPTRFLINQCQIITFLILKSDIIENSRIELRGIVLPVPSNQIKVALSVYYYFTLQLGTIVIFPVSYRNLRKNVGGLLEGAKGYVAPPLSNYWGGGPAPPPLPTPMTNIYHFVCVLLSRLVLKLRCGI